MHGYLKPNAYAFQVLLVLSNNTNKTAAQWTAPHTVVVWSGLNSTNCPTMAFIDYSTVPQDTCHLAKMKHFENIPAIYTTRDYKQCQQPKQLHPAKGLEHLA